MREQAAAAGMLLERGGCLGPLVLPRPSNRCARAISHNRKRVQEASVALVSFPGVSLSLETPRSAWSRDWAAVGLGRTPGVAGERAPTAGGRSLAALCFPWPPPVPPSPAGGSGNPAAEVPGPVAGGHTTHTSSGLSGAHGATHTSWNARAGGERGLGRGPGVACGPGVRVRCLLY